MPPRPCTSVSSANARLRVTQLGGLPETADMTPLVGCQGSLSQISVDLHVVDLADARPRRSAHRSLLPTSELIDRVRRAIR